MHGCISRWPAAMLAAMVLASPSGGWAESGQPFQTVDPSYATVAYDPSATWLASASAAPADDLASRVAGLEKSVAKLTAPPKPATRPSVEVGGRLYFDSVYNSQDDVNRAVYGEATNGVRFRTARLHAQGKAFEVVNYKVEVDFATSADVVFKDTYIGISELPLIGNLRFGHFKEPIGLEELTSSRYITFMERSMGIVALVPSRNMGVMAFDHTEDQRMTWALGLFHTDIGDAPPTRLADDLSQSVTGRVTYLPWYDEATEGRGLLHTGFAYSYRNAWHDQVRFRSRANESIGPYLVDTGVLNVTDYQLFDVELAMVYGPFSIQSEFITALADPVGPGRDMRFNSTYVQMSYFLTGEHRAYRRSSGSLDRVKPYENFFRVRAEDGCVYTGKGAWEVAYRYDYIDLTAASGAAGLASTHTMGVNWYLNPYTRAMANYVHADPSRNFADAGYLDAFMMRFQVDF